MGAQVPPVLMDPDLPATLETIVEAIEEFDGRLEALETRSANIMFIMSRAEAEAVRDVLARVSGGGPKATACRHVFEVLESAIGYDVMADDGLEGEIEG